MMIPMTTHTSIRTEISSPPPQLKDLWTTITTVRCSVKDNAKTVTDFVAEKMSRAWSGLEKALAGSFKSKLHSLGVPLVRSGEAVGDFLEIRFGGRQEGGDCLYCKSKDVKYYIHSCELWPPGPVLFAQDGRKIVEDNAEPLRTVLSVHQKLERKASILKK